MDQVQVLFCFILVFFCQVWAELGGIQKDILSLLLPQTLHRCFSHLFVSESCCAADCMCTESGKKASNFPKTNLTTEMNLHEMRKFLEILFFLNAF